MDWKLVYFQTAILRKTVVTNVTFEWFLSIVNWNNVFSRTVLVGRAVWMLYFHHRLLACVFSNCHFEKNSGHKCHIWVVSLLHEFLSYAFSNFSEGKFFGWQIVLLRKTLVTNITFERFLSLSMYFRCMFFHSLFLRAFKEQINLWMDL